MNAPLRRLAALAFGLVVVASCSPESTAPLPRAIAPSAEPSSDLLGTLTGGVTSLVTMDGLWRTTPLAAPITVRKTIGADGGTLAIPQAGVTVTIPRGALAKATTITMTARAGSLVAYDFAPHGITFARSLAFSQQLRGTNVSLLTAPLLRLGYYGDASQLSRTGALVSELLGGVVDVATWTFTGSIHHFSGYIVTCGRRGGSGD